MRAPRACSDSAFRRGQPVDVSANASKLSGPPGKRMVQKDFGGQITRREICGRCCVDPLRPPPIADIPPEKVFFSFNDTRVPHMASKRAGAVRGYNDGR